MGNRSFFNALHDREGDFLLATVLEGPAQGERVLLRNTAPVWPEELPAFWGEHLAALAAVTSSGILKSAGQRIFVERFGAAPQLVVCGGGHVGASVVRLAKLLGLPVTALEDRPEFAEELRQAGADAVLCLPFAEGLAQIPGGQETYFVVVTRAHSCDIACLRSILQKPAAYVGMMGSRKRAALVHTQLAELGLPQERMDALHAEENPPAETGGIGKRTGAGTLAVGFRPVRRLRVGATACAHHHLVSLCNQFSGDGACHIACA